MKTRSLGSGAGGGVAASVAVAEVSDDMDKMKLRTAAAVVVVWTPAAVKSAWVKLEADYGNTPDRNIIVNVVAEGLTRSDLPAPYDHFHRQRF
jgi:hypothetical protein